MANFVLNFLENTVRPFAAVGADVSNAIGNAEANIAQHLGFTPKTGSETNVQQFGKQLGNFVGQDTARNLASNVAQVGVSVLAPAIGRAVTPLASGAIDTAGKLGDQIAGKLGSRLTAGATKGAVQGAAIGGAGGVAQGVSGNKPIDAGGLAMDFLQGVGSGAMQGSVFGAAGGSKGTFNTATAVGGPVGNIMRTVTRLIDIKMANKLATSDSAPEIEKTLAPIVGKNVAHDVAPAISKTNDPNVVQNIVQNDLTKKLPTATQQPTAEEQSLFNTAPQNTEQQSLFRSGENLSPGDINNSPETQPTQQEGTPFINKPGEQPQVTHLSKLDAMNRLQSDLNAGLNVADATNRYIEATGEPYPQAQSTIAEVMKSQGVERNKINSELNPEYDRASKILPEVSQGDMDQARINPRVVHNELNRLASIAANTGNELNDNDRALMDMIHGKTLKQLLPKAEDKQAFTDAFNALKKYDDTAQGMAASLGVDVPYRQNHGLTMQWANSENEIKAAQAKKVALSKTPGYTKGRYINDYEEGQQLGLARKNDNIYQDLQDDLQQKQASLSQLALQKGLEEAYPGQVKVGDIGATPEEGVYKQLQIPYGQKISMPTSIANQINERAPAPESTGGWKGYDTFNGNWKNLKLGGGGFHSLNTLGNWFGQQLASGKIFTHPQDSINVLRSVFDPKFIDSQMKQWDTSGQTLLEDRAGLNANMKSTQGDIKAQGKLANIPGLKQIHEAVFGRQIPYMMKAMFHQQIEGLDPSNAADQAQMVKIAKSINQQFGAFNRDIQGVTPRTAKLAARGFLAWDWNEGQIRTLTDALNPKKGGVEGKLARQTVFGKALLFAGLATAAGAAGGEFKNQDPKQIAMDILQKTINPSFKFGNYTVGLPTTQLSEVGKPLSQSIGNAINGKNIATPLKDTLSARLAAIPSGVEQFAENRNFAGQPLRGTDYYGRPISAVTTAENLLGMATPIPITQGLQASSGQENIGAALANVAGVTTRPTYDLSYAPIAGQTYVAELKQAGAPSEQIQSDTQFFDLLGTLSKERTTTLKKAITDYNKKDLQATQKDIANYNAKLVKTLQPWIKSGGVKYLDPTMLQQLRSAEIQISTASKDARYYAKTNPIAYGGSLSSSPLAAAAAQSAGAFTNTSTSGNNQKQP